MRVVGTAPRLTAKSPAQRHPPHSPLEAQRMVVWQAGGEQQQKSLQTTIACRRVCRCVCRCRPTAVTAGNAWRHERSQRGRLQKGRARTSPSTQPPAPVISHGCDSPSGSTNRFFLQSAKGIAPQQIAESTKLSNTKHRGSVLHTTKNTVTRPRAPKSRVAPRTLTSGSSMHALRWPGCSQLQFVPSIHSVSSHALSTPRCCRVTEELPASVPLPFLLPHLQPRLLKARSPKCRLSRARTRMKTTK